MLVVQSLFVAWIIPTVYGGDFWKYKMDGAVVSVAVSADGDYTVAGSDIGSVFLFDDEGSLLWSHVFEVEVECVAISGDGSRVVVGVHEYRSGQPDIYLFDNLGNIVWQRDLVQGSWPMDVAISPDATHIVTGDTDDFVYLYDISGSLLWDYAVDDWVDAVSVSSGGEFVAAGSWDETLYFFNESGSLLWSKPFGNDVKSVSISPEGDYVAASSWDEDFFLFANDGDLVLQTQFYISIRAVSVSANADRIAVADYESITIIDKTANVIGSMKKDSSVEDDVAVTADGEHFAFGWGDNVYFVEVLPSSDIQCEVFPSVTFVGRSVMVNGSVQPQLSGEEVKLEYELVPEESTENGDGVVTVERTVMTSTGGSFEDVYSPTAAGEWIVTAIWSGGPSNMPSMSTSSFIVNQASSISLVSDAPKTLYWHREEWYCEHGDTHTGYVMDFEVPTSSEPEIIAFDPSHYTWTGHGHWEFTGVHTGPLSENVLTAEGLWTLSIWAAARDPDQHFKVKLCFWDENHEVNTIADWTTEYFNSTSPDLPTQFVQSFDLPAQIIPEGACLGFIIYDCRDSDVRWFFEQSRDATKHRDNNSGVSWMLLFTFHHPSIFSGIIVRKKTKRTTKTFLNFQLSLIFKCEN